MITAAMEYTLQFQEQEALPDFIPYSKTQPIPTSRGGCRPTTGKKRRHDKEYIYKEK
jgi:hypothetical protein